MAVNTRVDISWAGKSKSLALKTSDLILGRARDCDLVLPFEWVREKHFHVKCDGGAVRAKLIDPTAKVSVSGRELTTEWQLVTDEAMFELPASLEASLCVTFHFTSRFRDTQVLKKVAEPEVLLSEEAFQMEIAEESPLPHGSLFDVASERAAAISKRPAIRSRPYSFNTLVIVSTLLSMSFIGGALIWNGIQQARASRAFRADNNLIENNITLAKELIRAGKYIEGKAMLDVAEEAVSRRPQLEDDRIQIAKLMGSPEIKWGAAGYVLMEEQWLPPQTAQAWKVARQRDDPIIAEFKAKAQAAMRSSDSQAGRSACDEALAIMDAEPVKPHPEHDEIAELRLQFQNQIIAAEMTAKGLVLYLGKWVSPNEKFDLEQQAKGLVKYKEQWLSKEDAYAAEQTDKGLVLFQGKWMTPDAKMVAQGFVKFEDQWVKPQQRDSILADRAAKEREAQARAEQERIRLEAEAQARVAAARRIEEQKPIAYEMSQEFIKDQLKSPTSARFADYKSNDVTVVYTDGWYLVQAPVDAMNSFGVLLRKTYLCKLRPTGIENKWEKETCGFLDN